jgi:hypothetical protein
MSPYPVVVMVTITNQKADGILSKELINVKQRKLISLHKNCDMNKLMFHT